MECTNVCFAGGSWAAPPPLPPHRRSAPGSVASLHSRSQRGSWIFSSRSGDSQPPYFCPVCTPPRRDASMFPACTDSNRCFRGPSTTLPGCLSLRPFSRSFRPAAFFSASHHVTEAEVPGSSCSTTTRPTLGGAGRAMDGQPRLALRGPRLGLELFFALVSGS